MLRLSRRTLLRAAAALPLVGCQSAPAAARGFASCQALLDDYVADRRLAGAVLGVVRAGEAPTFVSTGVVALDNAQAMDPSSICRIYSMTKPVVGAAAMICESDGLFELDQPLAELAPEFADMRVLVNEETMETRAASARITIRHLLTHTAGFTYHINGNGPLQRLYRENGLFAQGRAYWPAEGDGPLPQTLDEFAARLAALPLAADPGARWEYSVAFDVLGLVIQRAADMAFDAYLKDRIFGPLGMADTDFFVPPGKVDRLTSNYMITETGLQLIDDRAASPFAVAQGVNYGGSGLVSTARDYAAFCASMLGGGRIGQNLLPPSIVTEGTMLRGAEFGAGVWIMTAASAKPGEEPPGAYSWGGASGTTMWIDPANQVAAVLMVQHFPITGYQLYSEIRQRFYADL